ncbi:MAG TPA: hypothetical protein PLH57_08700 [Oligoflexia bacterium]|nr:hypothetical protein [Oligoflexia bacterium]
MKRKILLTAVLATWLVGSNAFASIARLAVLGTQPSFTAANSSVATNVVNGSLWYDDSYNMFYNPSAIMDYKDYVTFQKGNSTSGNGGGEAGWVSSVARSFAYGIYVNRGGSAAAAYGDTARLVAPGINSATNTAFAGTSANALNTQRAIDLLFGGDTGIKWGGKLTWAYNRNQSIATQAQDDLEATTRYWHLALGAQVMGFEPFIGTTISSKFHRNNTSDKTLQATDLVDDMNVGVRYKYEAWTPYVTYRKFRRAGDGVGVNDPETSSGSTQVQTSMNVLGLGVGHDMKIADGVHLLKNVGVYYNSVVDTAGATYTNRDYKDYVLPVNFAIEADAASWLTLRAGAEYHLWNERKFASNGTNSTTNATAAKDKKTSQAGISSVRIGSTFKFGKLHIDSAFGNGATTNQTDQTQAIGFDANTFAFVSASYNW